MELVRGRALRDVIRAASPLPIDRVVRLLRPLAEALDHAHAHGVVHRDVKPTNVMIGADDRVTLLDFGIARAMEGSAQLTRAGLIVGTPEYMAPEVVTGGVAGANADLYALGVVAYEMLTGHGPFRGVSTSAVAYAHVHTPPPSPRGERTDLPEIMERALLRQLAKDPAARFPNARTFVEELERGLAAAHTSRGRLPYAHQARETTLVEPDEDVTPLPRPAPSAPHPFVPEPQPAMPMRRPVEPAPTAAPEPEQADANRGRSWMAVLVAALLLMILGGYGLLAWGQRQASRPTESVATPAAAATSAPAAITLPAPVAVPHTRPPA
jgi:serine/threonine protein kinase